MKKNILFFSLLLFSSLLCNGSIFATEKINQPQTVNDDAIAKAKHYENVVDSYLRGLNEQDLEGILSLYAGSATIEDPVGSNVISGIDAIRKFYSGAVTMELLLTRTGPVRVAAMEAVFPFQLRMEVNGVLMKTDIIDHFKFNEEGKIVSMRAFWGPSNRKIAEE
ncbi:MAG TPA: nuclear transport factor 2 family protein [Edaphocola sp.]|nr:nuclear transport factor 2 family protein [Edaphocola sp.]